VVAADVIVPIGQDAHHGDGAAHSSAQAGQVRPRRKEGIPVAIAGQLR
jgi:hypothetical protein